MLRLGYGNRAGRAERTTKNISVKGLRERALQSNDEPKKYLIVSNDAILRGSGYHGSVNIYRLRASGDAAPINIITGSLKQLTEVEGVAVTHSGQIYVANTDTTTIVGFAASATGDVPPVVVIGGSSTGMIQPNGLAIDANDNLYVANCGSCGHG